MVGEEAEVLRNVQAALEGYANFSRECITAHTFPEGGSQAQREIESAETIALSEAWDRNLSMAAFEGGIKRLLAAVDHLDGLRLTLQEPHLPFSAHSLGRAALEISGRAFWLLDPETTPRKRIARVVTEHLFTGWENVRAIREMRPGLAFATGAKDLRTETELDLLGIVRWAWENSYEAAEPERAAPWIGEPRPSATKLSEFLLPERGALAYKLWSALGHATQGGLGFLLPADDIAMETRAAVEDARLPELVGLLLDAYSAAFDRAVTTLGWPVDEWSAWKADALVKLSW